LEISKCRFCGQVHAKGEECQFEDTFRVLDDTQLGTLPPAEWDIGDVSQTGTLEIVYGPSGAGKSTLCAERACCKSTAFTWFGKAVRRPAPVVVVVLEGLGAFVKKIGDWKRRHGIEDRDRIGVYVVPDQVNLLDLADVSQLSKHIDRVHAEELIVDTLAQSLLTEEDNEAFQRAAAHAGIIRRQTGVRVTLIHHSGKDRARGARGGSSLVAAADTVLSVDDINGRHVVKCEKQRDGRRFDPFFLKLVPTAGGSTAYFEECERARGSLIPGGSADELDAAIVALLRQRPGTPKGAVAAEIHRQKADVLARLKALQAEGRIRVVPGGSTGRAELCELCE
jgi:AAA domain